MWLHGLGWKEQENEAGCSVCSTARPSSSTLRLIKPASGRAGCEPGPNQRRSSQAAHPGPSLPLGSQQQGWRRTEPARRPAWAQVAPPAAAPCCAAAPCTAPARLPATARCALAAAPRRGWQTRQQQHEGQRAAQGRPGGARAPRPPGCRVRHAAAPAHPDWRGPLPLLHRPGAAFAGEGGGQCVGARSPGARLHATDRRCAPHATVPPSALLLPPAPPPPHASRRSSAPAPSSPSPSRRAAGRRQRRRPPWRSPPGPSGAAAPLA